MPKRNKVFAAVFALAAACGAAAIFPKIAAAAIVLFASIAIAARMSPAADRKFILAVLIVAIALKCAVMTAYFNLWLLPGKQDLIGPDGEGFSQRGWYIAKVLRGAVDYRTPSNEHVFRHFYRVVDFYGGRLPPFNSRANSLFTYFIGAVYFLFGYAPLLLKTVNITFSAFSSVLLYRMALEIYSRNTARIAFLLFTFFPSIFIFSFSLLRDPVIILCALIAVHSLTRLAKVFRPKDVASLVLGLGVILFLREELFIIMSILSFFVIFLNRRFKHKTIITLAFIALLLAATTTGIFRKTVIAPAALIKDIAPMALWRNASIYYAGGELAYMTFPERHYHTYKKYAEKSDYLASQDRMAMLELLKNVPRAAFLYLVEPFPSFHGGLKRQLLSIHMIWWYLTLSLAVFGVFRKTLMPTYPIVLYLVTIVFMTSVVEANGGIALRHRDLIAPFVILFASSRIEPLSELFIKKGRIHE